MSQRKRKLVKEAFGWGKTIAGMAKVKVRGLARVRYSFWLILTPHHHNNPQQNERVLDAIRRFMVWRGAESFVLVCATSPGPELLKLDQEAIVAVSHVRGERLAL